MDCSRCVHGQSVTYVMERGFALARNTDTYRLRGHGRAHAGQREESLHALFRRACGPAFGDAESDADIQRGVDDKSTVPIFYEPSSMLLIPVRCLEREVQSQPPTPRSDPRPP